MRTWEGWVYVAFVLDAFSRRIVGWQLADHLRTDLTHWRWHCGNAAANGQCSRAP
ncbi:hypothetical protein [Actinomadura fibrosa]|uniref:Integrase catalytic domain-containing protein n=1 Tax=Actinomadura fibrosa TaxID=111802 RepID=A0ABW2XF43_9ACTN|nr:hypothetical protein [Actinomadura fibrosa]